MPLKVQSDENHTVITIPGMDLWAIVELTDKTVTVSEDGGS